MEEFVKTSWHNVTGKIYRTALAFDETSQPLPGNVIHHIHNYVDKNGNSTSIDVPEGLSAIDFVNSSVGYNNARGNPDFSVEKTDNAFVDAKGNSLFWEFYNGTGSENTVINGGKIIDDIKKMDSFKELKNEAFRKLNADDKMEPGESFKGSHKMSYKEGITEIWIPGLFKDKGDPSGPFGSTQHFLR